ncbi:uncharacterized protein [Physcomitrium patens]|uniref:Uncharacterized protein n=1 Tax=Physcomitrium patens TaxID=3218 RepID=A0A2K1IQY6_PHYPA|nr:uncharacterized protein LOC112274428 isoform X1 [Physcomitrium patens]PNR31696.1 hypothetical protein PHYPA_025818 [Physcomitrium patens]|eukprot:XP_024359698.1 uncharacterized protein LOC112274428 isoform X1 [Physcomitrella patens]
MLERSWCEAESSLTTEIDPAFVAAVPNGDAHSSGQLNGTSRRCVTPKVTPGLNESVQLVPEYWDQTVPVWPCGDAEASSKRKAKRNDGHGRIPRSRLHGHGGTPPEYNSLKNCFCNRALGLDHEGNDPVYPRGTARIEGGDREECNDEGGRRRADPVAAAQTSCSEVSFDAIMSMYQSSVVEKACQSSRGLGVKSKRISRKGYDDRRRLWRNFAGSFDILVLKWSTPRSLRRRDVRDKYSVRGLHVTFGGTSACDHSTGNSHGGVHLPIFQVWE